MKIYQSDIENAEIALVHLMLENTPDALQLIIDSDEWKLPTDNKDKVINVTMQFNGIETEPQVLETLLQGWNDFNNKYYQEKYSDIELEISRRVNEEVNKRMEESIDVLIKTLQPSNY